MVAPPDAATTFERHMRQGRGDTSLEERIEDLERQIDRLHRELERLLDGLRAGPGPGVVPEVEVGPRGLRGSLGPRDALIAAHRGVLAFTRPQEIAGVPRDALIAARPGVLPFTQLGVTGVGPSTGRGFRCACLRGDDSCGCKTVVRSYKLPPGKLEALRDLMVRSDVPIRVRPLEDRIEVRATEAQQCVFEAFCMMIDGEDRVQDYELPDGKLQALTELMVRDDIPILVEPGREQIKVHGTDLEQAVFDAFVRMIEPQSAARGASGTAQLLYAESLANLARSYEAKAAARAGTLRQMKAMYRSLQSQAGSLEQQARRLWDRAEELEERAQELEEEAEELRERGFMQRAAALLAQVRGFNDQARTLETQAETMESQAQDFEAEADQVEEKMEELEE